MEISREYKIEFAKLIEALRSAYPRYHFLNDDYSKMVWLKQLADIEISKLNLAVESFIMTSKWPPTIAELREMALKTEQEEVNWSYGWSLVNKAIGLYGQYRSTEAMQWIEEQDAVACETIRRTGFKDLCNSNEVEKGYFKNTFEKVYENLKAENKFNSQISLETKRKIELMREETKQTKLNANKEFAGMLEVIGGRN